MFPADADGVYARISTARGRRWFVVAALIGFGGLIVAVRLSPGVVATARVGLIAAGVATVWVADRMRRATLGELVLDAVALRDEHGHVLARMADIVQVEPGAFAIKSSDGFTWSCGNTRRALGCRAFGGGWGGGSESAGSCWQGRPNSWPNV